MDTIVALSTPFGVSGIAVIRCSGPQCLSFAQSIFQKENIQPRKAYHSLYHSDSGTPLDEVVFTFFAEKASYTGESMLEISCHGNPLIIQQIVQDLRTRGARSAEPGEFTRRAFMNDVLDLCQAEAVSDIIHAQSQQALTLAQHQLGGSLSRCVEHFLQKLTELIAMIEAFLDFPEEDLPKEDHTHVGQQLQELLQAIEKLLRQQGAYRPLQQGIYTVIVGLPNAGKSTLLNVFLGQERAIVSSIPGTTRDFLSEWFFLEPYALRLVDTAGLRTAENELEQKGIQQTEEQVTKADCLLWVIDGSQPWNDSLEALKNRFSPKRTFVILNKLDCGLHASMPKALETYTVCSLSLQNSSALSLLQDRLRKFLQQSCSDLSEASFMIHERHAAALQHAKAALQHAQALWQQHREEDCLVAELRTALHAFETIVGQSYDEQVLDTIFSKFCIGK